MHQSWLEVITGMQSWLKSCVPCCNRPPSTALDIISPSNLQENGENRTCSSELQSNSLHMVTHSSCTPVMHVCLTSLWNQGMSYIACSLHTTHLTNLTKSLTTPNHEHDSALSRTNTQLPQNQSGLSAIIITFQWNWWHTQELCPPPAAVRSHNTLYTSSE